MISFRYHLVSLVGVFLALALGVVIGTVALNGPVTSDLRHQVADLKKARTAADARVRVLQDQVDTAGQFAQTYAPQLVAGTLTRAPVLVVALPGASTGLIDAVSSELTAAGAAISGRLVLTSTYLDPAQSDSITTLATGPSHPLGLTYSANPDPRVLGAALLAYTLTGKGQPTDLKAVLSGFSALHMITSDPSGIVSARTVLLVGSGSAGTTSYAGEAEFDIVSQLLVNGATVVVAGDAGSATGNGIVAAVRNGSAKTTVSTVDNADTPFGQVTTALAVAGAVHAQIGQYGTAAGAQALFPGKAK